MYYCSNDDNYRSCDKCYGEYLGDGCGYCPLAVADRRMLGAVLRGGSMVVGRGAFTGIVYHVLWQLFGTYVMMQLFTGQSTAQRFGLKVLRARL